MSTIEVLLIGDHPFTEAVATELRLHSIDSEIVVDAPVSVDHLALTDRRVVVVDIDVLEAPAIESLRSIRGRTGAGLIAVCSDQECTTSCLAFADDVVARPDRVRELVARIRALLRRTQSNPGLRAPEGDGDMVVVGDIVLSRSSHRVLIRGIEVRLPLKQFQMLELLLLNAGRVLTRDTLVSRLWGPNAIIESNTLEVQMRRLRSVVEEDSAKPQRIKTVRGIGYLYSPQ